MNCEKCGASIDAGEERELRDQVFCEDCYIDALSPVRVCDPWAVYSAKSLERHMAEPPPLTSIQSEILRILTDSKSLVNWNGNSRPFDIWKRSAPKKRETVFF